MKYRIGCSGWSYSSFYSIPDQFIVKNWFKKTPENFGFTAKFPKTVTHDKYLVEVEEEVELFLENMQPLRDKTLALLIQLPPSMEIMPGLEGLRNLLPLLDNRFRYAVEVRHHSWFQDLAYNFFADNDICLVWSQLAKLRTPPIVTTDFLYVRFIGDRSIDEKEFGQIQKDRVLEMKKWANQIRKVDTGMGKGRGKEVSLAMIAANNHYAGFGPGTVNIFRNMVGLPELSWEDQQQIKDQLRQQKEHEKDRQSSNSNFSLSKQSKKRQASLTEFMK